jgi:hypothetical protein
MYFYQIVDQADYEQVVDFLTTRANQNGINPDVTNDIMIIWDDPEAEDHPENVIGKVYISQELLKLV